MLQPIHGGATARPFKTHINAYDMELYLRIAIELYLKRLVVGGIEKVFEINRNFRNEGADSTHNPEFTMLEAYEAYLDYNTWPTLTRELVQRAVVAALGTTVVVHDGVEYDLGSAVAGDRLRPGVGGPRRGDHPDIPRRGCSKLADAREVECDPSGVRASSSRRSSRSWSSTPCVQPTFVMDYPVETSPLTRQHREEPLLAEKWDLIGFGTELGTAYSELVDPIEQRAPAHRAVPAAAGGDPEAMQLDEDFLRALDTACLPPAAWAWASTG